MRGTARHLLLAPHHRLSPSYPNPHHHHPALPPPHPADAVLPGLLHFMTASSNEQLGCRCRATEALGLLFDGLAATCPAQLRQLAPTIMELGLKVKARGGEWRGGRAWGEAPREGVGRESGAWAAPYSMSSCVTSKQCMLSAAHLTTTSHHQSCGEDRSCHPPWLPRGCACVCVCACDLLPHPAPHSFPRASRWSTQSSGSTPTACSRA